MYGEEKAWNGSEDPARSEQSMVGLLKGSGAGDERETGVIRKGRRVSEDRAGGECSWRRGAREFRGGSGAELPPYRWRDGRRSRQDGGENWRVSGDPVGRRCSRRRDERKFGKRVRSGVETPTYRSHWKERRRSGQESEGSGSGREWEWVKRPNKYDHMNPQRAHGQRRRFGSGWSELRDSEYEEWLEKRMGNAARVTPMEQAVSSRARETRPCQRGVVNAKKPTPVDKQASWNQRQAATPERGGDTRQRASCANCEAALWKREQERLNFAQKPSAPVMSVSVENFLTCIKLRLSMVRAPSHAHLL